jgi:hypothetical protein
MGREYVPPRRRVPRVGRGFKAWVALLVVALGVTGGATGGRARAGDASSAPLLPTPALCPSGAVWDPPAFALDEIGADGTLTFLRTPGGLDELDAFLADSARAPSTRRKDGASSFDAVLRVHPSAPWTLVQWVMTSLARARIHRISFAVRPLAGGDEGVLPAFLPLDSGVETVSTAWRDASNAPTKLTVVSAAQEDDEGAVLAALVEATKTRAPRAAVAIDTPTLPSPSAGAVLRVLDLAYPRGCVVGRVLGDAGSRAEGRPRGAFARGPARVHRHMAGGCRVAEGRRCGRGREGDRGGEGRRARGRRPASAAAGARAARRRDGRSAGGGRRVA